MQKKEAVVVKGQLLPEVPLPGSWGVSTWDHRESLKIYIALKDHSGAGKRQF